MGKSENNMESIVKPSPVNQMGFKVPSDILSALDTFYYRISSKVYMEYGLYNKEITLKQSKEYIIALFGEVPCTEKMIRIVLSGANHFKRTY